MYDYLIEVFFFLYFDHREGKSPNLVEV